jgi:hypothetical protein
MKTVFAALIALTWAGAASGDDIGLYADSVGTICSATVAAGSTLVIQVWIEPDRSGFDAGAFRVAGLPGGWTSTLSRLDESIYYIWVFGDVTGSGVHFDLPEKRYSRLGVFILSIQATSEEHDVVLQVMPPTFSWPDAPTGCAWLSFSSPHGAPQPGFCVRGGRFTINGVGDCYVGVEPATWSQVRSMYR